MNLSEARILVTGGGRGIGRHLVTALAPQSGGVVVFDNDPGFVADFDDPPSNVWAQLCDVSSPDSVSAAFREIDTRGWLPNVVVNNAGLIHSAPLVNVLSRGSDRRHSVSDWRRVLDVNLSSVFYVTAEWADRMLARRQKGVAIAISSISANGNAGQTAYSAAKAGVNALAATWAKELGAFGLRFAAIAPGFIDTPSTHAALSESTLTSLKARIPMRRLGTLEDIERATRFVIESEYVNGAVIEVDGGLRI